MSDYRVPSMAQVRAIPDNGYRVISTFSGAGGSSLGYRLAGFKVLWANEFIPAAQETYSANFPDTLLDRRDIRSIRAEEILSATGLEVGELDLLDGSPPCASFSTAGKREKEWGAVKAYSDSQQRTDDLFFEFSRLLRGLRPKTFVAENVSGLVKGTAKGYFKLILAELIACGYTVKAALLNGAWLGLPQRRERLIFIGVRNDLGRLPVMPIPHGHQTTLREAFYGEDGLPGLSWKMPDDSQTKRLWAWCVAHGEYRMTVAAKAVLGRDAMMQHTICRYDHPTNTVVQGSQCLYHPAEPRTLSISELRRVSSFPDDFILTGGFAQQWERLGRAVPPFLMRSVASAVHRHVLETL